MSGIEGTGVPLTLSEAAWQRLVMATAKQYHWRVAHFRPARTASGTWATPMSGDVGVPDLILARDGVVLLVELKRHNGRLTPGQKDWLGALGSYGRVWTPKDWPAVWRELRDGPDRLRVVA